MATASASIVATTKLAILNKIKARIARNEPVGQACRAVGKSRSWFYKNRNRGLNALKPTVVNRRQLGLKHPQRKPDWLRDAVVHRKLEHPHESATKIAAHLSGNRKGPISAPTVRKILRERGLGTAKDVYRAILRTVKPRSDLSPVQRAFLRKVDPGWTEYASTPLRVLDYSMVAGNLVFGAGADGRTRYAFVLLVRNSFFPVVLLHHNDEADTVRRFVSATLNSLRRKGVEIRTVYECGEWTIQKVPGACAALRSMGVTIVEGKCGRTNGALRSFEQELQQLGLALAEKSSLAKLQRRTDRWLRRFVQKDRWRSPTWGRSPTRHLEENARRQAFMSAILKQQARYKPPPPRNVVLRNIVTGLKRRRRGVAVRAPELALI